MRLKNKIALITGAAQGIGRAIAHLFYKEGALVIIADVNQELGRKVVSSLGAGAVFMYLDVAQEPQWAQLMETIKSSYGRLDILVNNAGITGFLEANGPWDAENTDLQTWEKVMRVNATGNMLGCKYAIKLMKEYGGSIVNISSRSGIVGIPEAVAYAASKAAIRNHTKSVALYCAERKYGIRCNSIHPAAIMTPMWDQMLGEGNQREKIIQDIESGIPLGRFGKPIEVAYGALYLASDESTYVTGIELIIDGGILAGSEGKSNK